jgi:hypothetical protein
MSTTDTPTPSGRKDLSVSSGRRVHLTMVDRLAPWLRWCAVAIVLLPGACHRSPLGFVGHLGDAGASVFGPDAQPPGHDVAPDRAAIVVADAPPDVTLAPDAALVADAAPPVPAPPDAVPPPVPEPVTPGCQPRAEVCNGADDDCDGKVDEDLAPIPCPNGGSRYCVAGRTSECPRVCDVCRPGSRRICFISYCTYWGHQTCASDGRSFGLCREAPVPPECDSIASAKKKSPELERCCIDNGYCCLDEFDLDGDGDRTEMLGRCGAVTCPP